ncbi:hypothetical protein DHEL01_v206647 [Diaporthe helianthi]|uniref:Uncharacterized protein n=1 Tax=Diaporthe helianthi TaxID=158607 RepID=A0A2P5HXH6_DIAHE|nr:hypothetical protein DHEL01_v206647 [Diaporthe helianthi]
MQDPQGAAFRASDSRSEWGGSQVSARTVMTEGRKPRRDFGHKQTRRSRGTPSVVSDIIRVETRPKRVPSVAGAGPAPGHQRLWVSWSAECASEAGSTHSRTQWSEYERPGASSCNMSVAGSGSDWYAVDNPENSSVRSSEFDGKGLNTSWQDGYSKGLLVASKKLSEEYQKGFADGHKAGVSRGWTEADKLA